MYRELVRLEAEPTFSFQDSFWLVDVAPDLLDTELREAVESARRRAKIRETAEADIPDHLLYESGWPRVIPTASEAELLCQVHRTVGGTLGRAVSYTEPHALIQRYLDLMRLRPNRKNWAANARPMDLTAGHRVHVAPFNAFSRAMVSALKLAHLLTLHLHFFRRSSNEVSGSFTSTSRYSSRSEPLSPEVENGSVPHAGQTGCDSFIRSMAWPHSGHRI